MSVPTAADVEALRVVHVTTAAKWISARLREDACYDAHEQACHEAREYRLATDDAREDWDAARRALEESTK
jgi:hypothetical protein